MACAALLVLTSLVWFSAGPLGERGVNSDLARLPSLLNVAVAYAEQIGEDSWNSGPGLLGDVTFRLKTTLPKTPDRVRVYRQEREPVDEAGARNLAQRMGIRVDSLVDDPGYGVFVATGDGGRLVISQTFRGYFSFESEVAPGARSLNPAPPPAAAPLGATITPAPDDAEAARAASDFLVATGALDFDHVVVVGSDAPAGATPLYRQVTFIPTAEGRPVRGLGIVVAIGPNGQVTTVQSAHARLAPGQDYPIVTADEAFRDLQAKRVATLQARVRSGSGSSAAGLSSISSTALRRAGKPETEVMLPAFNVGDTVELEGLLSAIVYEAKDGRRRYDATILAGPPDAQTRLQYRLTGPVVEELCALDQQHVRVRGEVQALSDEPPGGRLLLEHFEKLYPGEQLVALLGQLQVEGDRDEALVLLTDDGVKYSLERPGTPRSQREYQGRRAVVEGRTTNRLSDAGYPVIELTGIRSGSDIDELRDLSHYEIERPQVVPEREPLLKGEVAVDSAALEYHALRAAELPPRFPSSDMEPFLLVQPIFSFSGTFDEGRGSFEAQVPAVRPEYVEGLVD